MTSEAVFGFLAGVCFVFAGGPSAWESLKLGKNIGVPLSLAWAVFCGVCLQWIYVALHFHFWTLGVDWLLTATYGVEAFCYGTLLWFSYFPRKTQWT